MIINLQKQKKYIGTYDNCTSVHTYAENHSTKNHETRILLQNTRIKIDSHDTSNSSLYTSLLYNTRIKSDSHDIFQAVADFINHLILVHSFLCKHAHYTRIKFDSHQFAYDRVYDNLSENWFMDLCQNSSPESSQPTSM